MKTNRYIASFVAASALALPLWLGACDREVSHTSSTSVKDDGTVKTQEKTITQAPDGTVTKEETKKTTTPQP